MATLPKYGIGDRVFVPTTTVQGLIVGLNGRLNEEFLYTLRYPDFQTGAPVDFTYAEGEVVKSNAVEDTAPHLKSQLAVANSQAITLRGTIAAMEKKLEKATSKKKR